MPTRVRWLVVGLIALVIVVGLGLWATSPAAGERPDFESRLAAAASAAGTGGTVALSDATDFAWEEVHVFDSYTTQADVQSELGWNPLSPLEKVESGDLFLASDGAQLVVFTSGSDVVAWAYLGEPEAQANVRFQMDQEAEFIARPDLRYAVDEIAPSLWRLNPP